eukprot:INCI16392.10.p1 GENE.INCI16392.10~~INCI16392.10.p1  ORF type:complete len:316 (+),score=49.29 INCI16392.10:2541-3488(+)
MLDERPLEQAQSVISFYIACANDLARWFSVLHQLVAAGGDDPSLDEIAGISSSKELSLAEYMALAAAMGDDMLVSQAEGEAISATMTNAAELDVTNPHARAWYQHLRKGLDRVSWLILEASFTIACAEAAASQNSGGKTKATGNPFEGIVGPKIASDASGAARVQQVIDFVLKDVLENLQPQLLRVAFAGVLSRVGTWVATRYFREMNRAYSKSNFLNKYELRPDHVDGLEDQTLFSDSHANSLNRNVDAATAAATQVEITEILASLTRAELPIVREWVESQKRKGDYVSVSKLRNLAGLPSSHILVPQVPLNIC